MAYYVQKTYQGSAFHIAWGAAQTISADPHSRVSCTVCHQALDLTCFYGCEVVSSDNLEQSPRGLLFPTRHSVKLHMEEDSWGQE